MKGNRRTVTGETGLMPAQDLISPDYAIVWLTTQPDVSLTEQEGRAMAPQQRSLKSRRCGKLGYPEQGGKLTFKQGQPPHLKGLARRDVA
jgi:hypothetical protein